MGVPEGGVRADDLTLITLVDDQDLDLWEPTQTYLKEVKSYL